MKGELLLIEDNPDTQMIVRRILERQEYSIRTANDGISGLKLIEEVQPKVVLLDISLPEMDGMEVARSVRQHENEELRKTVLIALTAMGTTGDRDRFFDAGCDDHLPKPFRAVQLVEMVRVYLSDSFVPGETSSPGGRRREKLQEMAALRESEEEKERQAQARAQEKAQARKQEQEPPALEVPPAEVKKMPGPKPLKDRPKEKEAASRKDFEMNDNFLSDLLDPGSVEPVDPPEE